MRSSSTEDGKKEVARAIRHQLLCLRWFAKGGQDGCRVYGRCVAAILFLVSLFFTSLVMASDNRSGPPSGGPPGGGPPGGPPGGWRGGDPPSGGPPSFSGSPGPFGSRPGGGGPGGTPNGSFTDDDPSVVRPQVLDGVKSGRYRSLREVLGNLKLPEGSRLIDVDLRYLSNGDFYLLTIKDMSGRFRTLKVDARTGKLAR